MSEKTERFLREVMRFDLNMPLAERCADFYMLEMLKFQGNRDADYRFGVLAKELSEQFGRYIDMAVGGELRHAVDESPNLNPWPNELHRYLYKVREKSRSQAWRLWIQLRRQDAGSTHWFAEAARMFVDDEWPGGQDPDEEDGGHWGTGGPGWATAAEVAFSWFSGRVKPVTFVDRCWTLQHNYGNILDKVWYNDCRDGKLAVVLEAQAKADPEYRKLNRHCSTEVRQLWAAHIRAKRSHYSVEWLGMQETEV